MSKMKLEKDERNLIIGFLVGVFSSVIAEWAYEDRMVIISWIQDNLWMSLAVTIAIISIVFLATRKTIK